MSFGITTPCWNCSKKDSCNDAKHIQDGITAAHTDAEGKHKGSGTVVVMCCKCVANN